jgi:hypothetical protein
MTIVMDGVFEVLGITRQGVDRWVHLISSLIMSTALGAFVYEELKITFL